MNQQQQHSQTPQDQHQNQVPDHRLNEALERIRQLELQNAQLRTTVDMTVRQQLGQQPQGQQPGSAFKPEVLQELKAVMDAHLAPLRQQIQHQMGMFYDQIDETRFACSIAVKNGLRFTIRPRGFAKNSLRETTTSQESRLSRWCTLRRPAKKPHPLLSHNNKHRLPRPPCGVLTFR